MLTSQTTEQKCPCGSNRPFAFCCEPYIEGVKPAPTAEKLMRSRYTAFVLGAIDYLINTTAPESKDTLDPELMEEQMHITTWTGLTILGKEAGEAGEEKGIVEFEAGFEADGVNSILHERSNFYAQNGHWYYLDGEVEIKPSK